MATNPKSDPGPEPSSDGAGDKVTPFPSKKIPNTVSAQLKDPYRVGVARPPKDDSHSIPGITVDGKTSNLLSTLADSRMFPFDNRSDVVRSLVVRGLISDFGPLYEKVTGSYERTHHLLQLQIAAQQQARKMHDVASLVREVSATAKHYMSFGAMDAALEKFDNALRSIDQWEDDEMKAVALARLRMEKVLAPLWKLVDGA